MKTESEFIYGGGCLIGGDFVTLQSLFSIPCDGKLRSMFVIT